MREKRTFRILSLAGVLAGSAAFIPGSPAGAAGFLELDVENVPTVVGAVVGVLPDYRGSDDYSFGIAPFFRYTFEGQLRYVQLMGNELTVNLLNTENFRLGPLVNYHFGRDDDIEDEKVSQMEEIDNTVEAGLFADYVWTDPNEMRHRFLVGAKLYGDVGGESDGFRTNISARYWHPVAKPVDLNLSAGFIYQDDDYADHYFGVNTENVGTSNLPLFTAEGGVNEYYVVVGGIVYLSKNWLLSGGVRASVIAGDPADSPIVDQQGDSTQWIAGFGVGYAF